MLPAHACLSALLCPNAPDRSLGGGCSGASWMLLGDVSPATGLPDAPAPSCSMAHHLLNQLKSCAATVPAGEPTACLPTSRGRQCSRCRASGHPCGEARQLRVTHLRPPETRDRRHRTLIEVEGSVAFGLRPARRASVVSAAKRADWMAPCDAGHAGTPSCHPARRSQGCPGKVRSR